MTRVPACVAMRLLVFHFIVGIAAACTDGSAASCAIRFSTNDPPSAWSADTFYDPGISKNSCIVNSTACVANFRRYYAQGVTCDSLETSPSSGLIGIAVIAFLIGTCSLCTPCATPTCCCGRASPTIACVAAFLTHLALFSAAAAALTAAAATARHTIDGWSDADMGRALAAAMAGAGPTARVLFATGSLAPLKPFDILAGEHVSRGRGSVVRAEGSKALWRPAGIATGPIGFVGLALVVLVVVACGATGGKAAEGGCFKTDDCCAAGSSAGHVFTGSVDRLPTCGCFEGLCQGAANCVCVGAHAVCHSLAGVSCHAPDCSFCSDAAFW